MLVGMREGESSVMPIVRRNLLRMPESTDMVGGLGGVGGLEGVGGRRGDGGRRRFKMVTTEFDKTLPDFGAVKNYNTRGDEGNTGAGGGGCWWICGSGGGVVSVPRGFSGF